MPKQAPLRTIKAWYPYREKSEAASIQPMTRGFYVLYKQMKSGYHVRYIGVGGLGEKSAIGGRIKGHIRNKKDWTHFSYFEVHDNVTSEDILELEGLLLQIFRDDDRIDLTNLQVGSKRFRKVRVNRKR
jgi:hypothetical protein